jgi:hypothetical protein
MKIDYKDILAIVIVVVLVFGGGKFIPNNPLNMLWNYIENLFIRKS